jgi:hypothetical protein
MDEDVWEPDLSSSEIIKLDPVDVVTAEDARVRLVSLLDEPRGPPSVDEGRRAASGVGYPVMPRMSAPWAATRWRASAVSRSVGCGMSKITLLTVPVNANGSLSA